MTRRILNKMLMCAALEFQREQFRLTGRHPSGIKTSLSTAGISSPPHTGNVVDPRSDKKVKDEEAKV